MSIFSIAVAAWKFLMPSPGALDDRLQRLKGRLPAELAFNFFGRGKEPGRVAGASRLFDAVDLSSGDFTAGRNHFANAGATTRAEIIEFTSGRAQRQNVRQRKIDNVDVIANAGAVRRLIIGAVNFHVRLLAERDFEHIRNQMRFDPMVLAEIC